MTNAIREAVRVELARRDMNRVQLAEKTGLSRQYVGGLISGQSGKLIDGWARIFSELGLELIAVSKGEEKGR